MRQPLVSDRQGFDRRWYAPNVAAVYTPGGIAELEATVQTALASYGDGVKVTSGRHCYEDFVYGDDTRAIIDMSGLDEVGYDSQRDAFYVDAGCENWTVYRTLLNQFGRTLPAGSCYSVGAGGHITGGGYGLLSRLRGLTVDHLTGVDIVTWDPQAQQATLRYVGHDSTDTDEQDLFWALRGAGCGNFGVIARYYFGDLPTAPDQASVLALAWDWADMTADAFAELLTEYGNWIPAMPEAGFGLLKLNHQQQGQIGLVYQYASEAGVSAAEHRERAVAELDAAKERFDGVGPLRELRRPLGGHPGMMTATLPSATVTTLTYLEALQTMNGSGPNQFGKYKSAYMRKGFPADQITAIWEYLRWAPPGLLSGDMAQTLLQVDSYGGQINTVGSTDTPVPQRDSILKLQYQTYWSNDSVAGVPNPPADAQQAAHLAWIRGLYSSVYSQTGGTPDPARDPSGTVDGCYFNYPDVDLGSNVDGTAEAALRLYFKENFRDAPRNLVAIKGRWDPANVFRHAQSLPVS